MHVVLVNRETNQRHEIPDCEAIALVDLDHQPHAPQYYVPNARQQQSATAVIITRRRSRPLTYKTALWELRKD
ncbi:hypothetical protein ACRYI5_05980 [Furfurilactobacillus sp. WILCCON 0119]|uniref:hypothetical protein n=1 Tax=Furfurilactobacillus entadae TaxID=2922307 RepID=UPI0035EA5316